MCARTIKGSIIYQVFESNLVQVICACLKTQTRNKDVAQDNQYCQQHSDIQGFCSDSYFSF